MQVIYVVRLACLMFVICVTIVGCAFVDVIVLLYFVILWVVVYFVLGWVFFVLVALLVVSLDLDVTL